MARALVFLCKQVALIRPDSRRPLHVAMALLVVATMAHCAAEWHAELGLKLAAHGSRQVSSPLGQPAGEHNESSCLCRGATLATSVGAGVPELPSGWLEILPSGDAANFLRLAKVCEPFSGYRAAPPLAGRQLRALYASLLI